MTTQPQMREDEAIQFALRALYGRYGYSHYKMNKFEEYDLYAKNKDFLVSEGVITFTDGTGKLMALKPDVTLSIVKNSKDDSGSLQKVYYTENVYRLKKGSRSFGEIMQTGLECIGDIDGYCLSEVLRLALCSLEVINGSRVLDVSHLGILSEVFETIGLPASERKRVLACVGEKNFHELQTVLTAAGVSEQGAELLRKLLRISGEVGEVLPGLTAMLRGVVRDETLDRFTEVLSAMKGEKALHIDFSVVGDMNYYNGFVFKGFVEGIPQSVLSGGQYDMLMKRMGRKSGAVGFAVYLDMIGQYGGRVVDYDVDTLLLYDGDEDLRSVAEAVKSLTAMGQRVRCDRVLPQELRFKRLMKLKNGRLEILEDHA